MRESALKAESASTRKGAARLKRIGLFPVAVLVLYGVLYLLAREKTLLALQASGRTAVALSVPLAFVLMILFLMNLLVRPSQVAGLLGAHAGSKAMLLALAAGIISAGPIFAWYPLLKKLKAEGAGEGPIAVFLYNRAVKPFLLPVMIGYYGWQYVLVLTLLMISGSLVLGCCIGRLVRTG